MGVFDMEFSQSINDMESILILHWHGILGIFQLYCCIRLQVLFVDTVIHYIGRRLQKSSLKCTLFIIGQLLYRLQQGEGGKLEMPIIHYFFY